MEHLEIGWEGAEFSDDCAINAQIDPRRAICLCFEGGPGSLKNVWSAVCNGTPALVVQGAGGVSDIISDCLLFYKHGADGDQNGSEYEGVSQEFTTQALEKEKRLFLISEFEKVMSEPKVEQSVFVWLSKIRRTDFTLRGLDENR